MIFDMPECGGCRTCELACSFHNKKEFNPNYSSIKVLDKDDSKGYKILFGTEKKGIVCDGCVNCNSRACLEVCEIKEDLDNFINTFLSRKIVI